MTSLLVLVAFVCDVIGYKLPAIACNKQPATAFPTFVACSSYWLRASQGKSGRMPGPQETRAWTRDPFVVVPKPSTCLNERQGECTFSLSGNVIFCARRMLSMGTEKTRLSALEKNVWRIARPLSWMRETF